MDSVRGDNALVIGGGEEISVKQWGVQARARIAVVMATVWLLIRNVIASEDGKVSRTESKP